MAKTPGDPTNWLDTLPHDLYNQIFCMVHTGFYQEVVRDIDELVNHEYYPEFELSELIVTSRQPVNRGLTKHHLLVNYSSGWHYPSRLLEVWNYTNLNFDDLSTHEMKTYLP